MWFEELVGFREDSVADVADRFVVDGPLLTSKVNGRTMRIGTFETPSLADLRAAAPGAATNPGAGLTTSEVVDDVQRLHADPANVGALFQVASQFNTLEMASPDATPEHGVAIYEHDRTQGPACAIACGAGTIYRNYLVPVDGRRGQSSTRQINCLADVAETLDVEIAMRNGYALPNPRRLREIDRRLAGMDETARDDLMGRLRIGVQWDTEVTVGAAGHTVSQAYCSAVPVAYSASVSDEWERLGRLVLDGAYEATLAAATINAAAAGNPTVFLTLLGGGVFGNPVAWIADAVERALDRFSGADLDVRFVSYGSPSAVVAGLLRP